MRTMMTRRLPVIRQHHGLRDAPESTAQDFAFQIVYHL
jgi:hypothetical protein